MQPFVVLSQAMICFESIDSGEIEQDVVHERPPSFREKVEVEGESDIQRSLYPPLADPPSAMELNSHAHMLVVLPPQRVETVKVCKRNERDDI